MEQYIHEQCGPKDLKSRKYQTELRKLKKQIADLKKKLAAVEARRAESRIVGEFSVRHRLTAGAKSSRCRETATENPDYYRYTGSGRSATACTRRSQWPRIARFGRCGDCPLAGGISPAVVVMPAARSDHRRSGAIARLDHRLVARSLGTRSGAIATTVDKARHWSIGGSAGVADARRRAGETVGRIDSSSQRLCARRHYCSRRRVRLGD